MICGNTKCGKKVLAGSVFCEACLTGMCYGKLNVYKMFKLIDRGKPMY